MMNWNEKMSGIRHLNNRLLARQSLRLTMHENLMISRKDAKTQRVFLASLASLRESFLKFDSFAKKLVAQGFQGIDTTCNRSWLPASSGVINDEL
jgi:hypothetical protein